LGFSGTLASPCGVSAHSVMFDSSMRTALSSVLNRTLRRSSSSGDNSSFMLKTFFHPRIPGGHKEREVREAGVFPSRLFAYFVDKFLQGLEYFVGGADRGVNVGVSMGR